MSLRRLRRQPPGADPRGHRHRLVRHPDLPRLGRSARAAAGDLAGPRQPGRHRGFLGLSRFGWICFVTLWLSCRRLIIQPRHGDRSASSRTSAGPIVCVVMFALAVWILVKADWTSRSPAPRHPSRPAAAVAAVVRRGRARSSPPTATLMLNFCDFSRFAPRLPDGPARQLLGTADELDGLRDRVASSSPPAAVRGVRRGDHATPSSSSPRSATPGCSIVGALIFTDRHHRHQHRRQLRLPRLRPRQRRAAEHRLQARRHDQQRPRPPGDSRGTSSRAPRPSTTSSAASAPSSARCSGSSWPTSTLRKRRVDVDELYNEHGAYSYRRGWNPLALKAFFPAAAVGDRARARSRRSTTASAFSWFVGAGLGAALYLALSRAPHATEQPRRFVREEVAKVA